MNLQLRYPGCFCVSVQVSRMEPTTMYRTNPPGPNVVALFCFFVGLASLELNIAPGNPWLEDESPLGPGLSS